MGFLSLSGGTYARFRVAQQVKPADHPRLFERMQGFAFRPMEEGSAEERSLGWAPVTDPFGGALREEDVFLGEYLVLSLRLDRKTIPSRLARHLEGVEIRRLMEGRGTDRIGRREKQEIRERVRLTLFRRALPGIRVFDMAWHLKSGSVLFASNAASVCETFASLFEETFEMGLVRETAHDLFAAFVKGGVPADIRPARMT